MTAVGDAPGRRLHIHHAIFTALESLLLFVMGPVLLVQAYTLLVPHYGLPGVSNVSGAVRDASYIGLGILVLTFFATLYGNERLSGLAIRAFDQALVAFYAIYVVGRTYSFVVDGSISVTISIFPIALASACIALLKFIPCIFEHIEKRVPVGLEEV